MSRFRGQNPLVPCLHMRRSGLCRQPDPPVWVGFQDLSISAREIFDLCNARDPGGGRVTTVWTAESFVQILGVRRSAVYRWKPGLCVAAAPYSGPGRCKMSGVALAPVSVCCSRSHYVWCFGGIKLPQSDCVIQLLPLRKQLDSYP